MDAQTKKLVKPLEEQFSKLPPLPVGVREFMVTVAPWLALVLGVLAVLAFATAILGMGVLSGLAPYYAQMGYGVGGLFWIPLVVGLAEGVLWLLAFQPLRKHSVKGWDLMFWVFVLGLVGSLLSSGLYFSTFGIVWAIIWLAIELYLLFQIKSYYK
jgi:hypothetical protein